MLRILQARLQQDVNRELPDIQAGFRKGGAWQPSPAFLPVEPHGQRSLEGYGPRGHKESDMTEATEQAALGHPEYGGSH